MKEVYFDEIDENTIQNTTVKWGDLIQSSRFLIQKNIIGVCIPNGNFCFVDKKLLIKLENTIGEKITYQDCYLYNQTTKYNALPIIVKKCGKIYAIAPLKVVKEENSSK